MESPGRKCAKLQNRGVICCVENTWHIFITFLIQVCLYGLMKDKRGQLRKYGYALRGITPVYTRFISKGERMNAIASMSTEGIIALEIVKGSVNGDYIL